MPKIIMAIGPGGLIGDSAGLCWNDPNDLRYFQHMTMGCDVVAGRHTARLLPPLSGRRLHMVSRTNPLKDILSRVKSADSTWSIGGADTYERALKAGVVDIAYITYMPNPNFSRPVDYDSAKSFDISLLAEFGLKKVTTAEWRYRALNGRACVRSIYTR